ncbi:E3 ubiquitin-protein ligase RAD18 [Callorhinchus milii]|uniref:E3 ubiquitin-protein ligase RAD18 n=1 Tax=Callorhinchus milii TaxID=7868 RepID=UPI001C3F5556|nr:E3 ubiquitin-protein ligase RAD18 [Callorhinchus milii]
MYQFETRRLLKPVDDLLRCGICFEYFDIAMIIPQCSHNYCSLCVRKFLSYKTQCPICCATVTEPELRNNRLLDELVKCFRSVRELLLECDLEPSPSPTQTMPKSASEKPPGGPRGHANMAPSITAMERFLTRSPSSKLAKASLAPSIKQLKGPQQGKLRAIAARTASVSSDNTALPSESIALCTEAPSTSSLAAKVQCPICSVDISEANINRHLDNCLAREDKIESLRSTTMKRKLMPKVVYNLLSDRDLKKRLKECGLSSQGTKAQLIKRHQAFVQMYNAQCDSLNPQSAAEIVKKIESNEKSQAQLEKQASQNVLKFSKNQSEKEIDEIHTNYRKKHQREFQQLIDKLKNRGNERKVKCEEKESKIEGYF